MEVSIWLVRSLVRIVEDAGGSRAAFLSRAGLDPQLLERSEVRLALEDYMRTLDAAVEVSGNPALGLHLGEHASPAMYHLVAHLVEHASTLGEGIEMMLRYSELLASGFAPRLIDGAERVSLRLDYLRGDSGPIRLTAEFALAGMLRMLRQYLGESVSEHVACFAYPAPAYASEYRRVFAGAERFSQPFTEMQFPRAWLARSQLFANPALKNLLMSQAERELAQLEHGGGMVVRVQRVLAQSNPRDLPSMNDVARELDISARTLARKLQTEGVTYAALLDDRRTHAAKRLLEARRSTIQQVAHAMGFADAPAFHRAFRRWTGVTPKQYVESVRRAV